MERADNKAFKTLMGGVLFNSKASLHSCIRHFLTVVILIFSISETASAQKIAVKTNLLYDATATVNAGVEIGLAPKWTLDVSGNFNSWPIRGHKWKHWMVQPEARYWFCDRFAGNFLGLHALGGAYNIGYIPNDIRFLGQDFSLLTDHRYQGYAIGGGVAYGYAWALAKHLNLEFELGVGYIYTRYDSYECFGCGKMVAEKVPYHYVGPTKAAVSLVYVF